MQIIDRRREGDDKPIPENWGLLPSGSVLGNIFWIVDLDKVQVAQWGIGTVEGDKLIIFKGGME